MSHDVDWRRQGAPIDHIFNRRHRFEESAIKNIKTKNPYYNIPDYMALEEKFNIKSTFFFRTMYENGDFIDYESDIQELIRGGWEIGLHTDPSSITEIERIRDEKTKLESLTGETLLGNRVHYLGFNKDLPFYLQKLGFKYDSSVAGSKTNLQKMAYGYFRFERLIEFPITLMDAYMFTYMGVTENQIINVFEGATNHARNLNPTLNILTVIWHDNVLCMKGGRMYGDVLNFLTSQEDVRIVRGMDLIDVVENIKIS